MPPFVLCDLDITKRLKVLVIFTAWLLCLWAGTLSSLVTLTMEKNNKNAINVAQQLSRLEPFFFFNSKKVNFNESWDQKDTSGGWTCQVFNLRMCVEKLSELCSYKSGSLHVYKTSVQSPYICLMTNRRSHRVATQKDTHMLKGLCELIVFASECC